MGGIGNSYEPVGETPSGGGSVESELTSKDATARRDRSKLALDVVAVGLAALSLVVSTGVTFYFASKSEDRADRAEAQVEALEREQEEADELHDRAEDFITALFEEPYRRGSTDLDSYIGRLIHLHVLPTGQFYSAVGLSEAELRKEYADDLDRHVLLTRELTDLSISASSGEGRYEIDFELIIDRRFPDCRLIQEVKGEAGVIVDEESIVLMDLIDTPLRTIRPCE